MSENINHPYRALKSVVNTTDYSIDELYLVMFAFVLGGWKALISSSRPDGFYFEVTHNQSKNETYVDKYEKVSNIALKGKEQL